MVFEGADGAGGGDFRSRLSGRGSNEVTASSKILAKKVVVLVMLPSFSYVGLPQRHLNKQILVRNRIGIPGNRTREFQKGVQNCLGARSVFLTEREPAPWLDGCFDMRILGYIFDNGVRIFRVIKVGAGRQLQGQFSATGIIVGVALIRMKGNEKGMNIPISGGKIDAL